MLERYPPSVNGGLPDIQLRTRYSPPNVGNSDDLYSCSDTPMPQVRSLVFHIAIFTTAALSIAPLCLSATPCKFGIRQEAKSQTRKERLLDLFKEQNAVRAVFAKEMEGVKPSKKLDEILHRLKTANSDFAERMLALAKEDPKDPVAFIATFSAFIGGAGSKTTANAADFIVSAFADDKQLLPNLPQIANSSGGRPLLEKLARLPAGKVVGAARFALLDAEIDDSESLQVKGKLSPKAVQTTFSEYRTKLEKLDSDLGNVKVTTRLGETIHEATTKKIFYLDNLTLGKIAPDFECETVGGTRERLSDYRGKVVVLDMWATWCTPCKAMIPHERAMIDRLKTKPFKLVSVSVDDTKDILTKFLEKEAMPWTQMWNGPQGGVVDAYQLQFFPTIYVLDASGRIRFKNLRDQELENAIDSLLAEMEKTN